MLAKQYNELEKIELENIKKELENDWQKILSQNLKLDMSRGKPSPDQLDLTNKMLLSCLDGDFMSESGIDCRNYGVLDGLPEAKRLFTSLLGVTEKQMIIGGNSSLQMMYDTMLKALLLGVYDGVRRNDNGFDEDDNIYENPNGAWAKENKELKFLCPVPGYDRHFAITESLGFKMINIPMGEDGPYMDIVEKYVNNDASVKGIWCVPKYSNPSGVTYSDETVRRFAKLKPAAANFRIFWDNAYAVHHLSDDGEKLLDIIAECEKSGNPDIVYEFTSTSKISFPGGGLAILAASESNINFIKNQMSFQTIGFDKLNQLRHVRFFKDASGIIEHMKKHEAILRPKFDLVLQKLEEKISPYGIGKWHNPKGGYFISFEGLKGTAKRAVHLCKKAGVILTGAGAPFPYSVDPDDNVIRIAPTYPSLNELEQAMEVFILAEKIAAVEVLIKG